MLVWIHANCSYLPIEANTVRYAVRKNQNLLTPPMALIALQCIVGAYLRNYNHTYKNPQGNNR